MNLPFRWLSLSVLVWSTHTSPVATNGRAAPSRAALYAALAGQWTGTLEYRDYSRPDTRVTLPTKLSIVYVPDSVAMLMHYVYDDGPGKIVEDDDKFAANASVTSVSWGDPKSPSAQQFSVRDVPGAKSPIALVLQGEGRDNDKPATIRETFTISRDTLRILKETRETGGAFAFRHEYVMHRR